MVARPDACRAGAAVRRAFFGTFHFFYGLEESVLDPGGPHDGPDGGEGYTGYGFRASLPASDSASCARMKNRDIPTSLRASF